MTYQQGIKQLKDRRELELSVLKLMIDDFSVEAEGILTSFNHLRTEGRVSESFLDFLNELGADAAAIKMKMQDKARELHEAITGE